MLWCKFWTAGTPCANQNPHVFACLHTLLIVSQQQLRCRNSGVSTPFYMCEGKAGLAGQLKVFLCCSSVWTSVKVLGVSRCLGHTVSFIRLLYCLLTFCLEIVVHNITDEQPREDLEDLSPGGIPHKSIRLSKHNHWDFLHVISGCCSGAPPSLLHSSQHYHPSAHVCSH